MSEQDPPLTFSHVLSAVVQELVHVHTKLAMMVQLQVQILAQLQNTEPGPILENIRNVEAEFFLKQMEMLSRS